MQIEFAPVKVVILAAATTCRVCRLWKCLREYLDWQYIFPYWL